MQSAPRSPCGDGLFETYVGFGIAAGNTEFYEDRGGLSGNSARHAIAGGPPGPVVPCPACRAGAWLTHGRCSDGRWTCGGYLRAATFGLPITPIGASIFCS